MIELFRSWVNRYFSDPQLIILGFLLVFGFVLIYALGDMLTPVLAGIVIAYLLEGFVVILQRLKLPRHAAVIIVFICFLAFLVVLLLGLLPLLSQQIGQLLQDLPTMVAKGQAEMIRLPERYPGIISESQIAQILDYIGSELVSLGQHGLSLSLASVKGIISVIIYLVLVPLLVFFFLKDKTMILEWVESFLPEDRTLAKKVWREANQQIINYIRGKMWEILFVWGFSYITFILLELKFAMLIALFVGLSVLIPYIGATLMTLPVALIAIFQWGLSSQTTYTIIAYGVIQLLDGNLLAPLLLSEVVNLHPIAIIVAILVFGEIWGIWGLFFAIPLATLLHAVLKVWMNSVNISTAPAPKENK